MLSLITLATSSLSSLSAASITYSGLINSSLVHHLIGHEILHVFFGLLKGPRRSRLTRAQRRKIMNRRRRWFTDNIIMHHKRLHDRNRQLVVSSTRAKILAQKHASASTKEIGVSHKWRDRVDTSKERGQKIRGRIDARRIRARSRWVSVQKNVREKPSAFVSRKKDV